MIIAMEQLESVLKLALRKKTITIFSGLAVIALIMALSHVFKGHTDAWIGVIAALAVVPAEQCIDVVVQYRRFHRLEGSYTTHSYAKENPSGAYIAYGVNEAELEQAVEEYNADLTFTTKSTAVIEYIGDSNLKITLSENNPPKDNRWVGTCVMESDEVGIMSWAYEHLGDNPEPWERNGIKRFSVVSAETKPVKASLFTYDDDRFGRELFIKVDAEDRVWLPGQFFSACWIITSLLVLFIVLLIA